PPPPHNPTTPPAAAPSKETAAVATGGPRPANQPPSDLLITVDEPANRLVALGEGRLLDQLGIPIESLHPSSRQLLLATLGVNLSEAKTRQLGFELRALASRGSSLYQVASLFG